MMMMMMMMMMTTTTTATLTTMTIITMKKEEEQHMDFPGFCAINPTFVRLSGLPYEVFLFFKSFV